MNLHSDAAVPSLRDVSIVYVIKNGGDLFRDVLAALSRCNGFEDAEILAIDSGSKDRTLEYARQYPAIRIHEIPPHEFGHGKTRNLGARMTTRPIIVFLVQDATPAAASFLEDLVRPLGDPRVAGVYGRQIAYDWTNRIEKLFMEDTYPPEGEIRELDPSGRVRIHDMFFSNVCSALRRSVWQHVPFDETIIMSEDQAWAKSALLRGWKVVYQASAAVYHSHNYRLSGVFQRNFDSGMSLSAVADDSLAEMVRYELRHLGAGIRSLVQTGDAPLIPSLLVHEAVRAAGFSLGRRATSLPRSLLRRFSLHHGNWDKARAR